MESVPRRPLLALLTVLTALLLSCADGSGTARTEGFTIVTSFYPMYLFAMNVAKDVPGVEVVNMTEPRTGCLHDYQLSTADMKVLERADVLVVNGAGMEGFLDGIGAQMPDLPVVEASRGMELIESGHGHEEHEGEGGEEGRDGAAAANPHVWVSPSGAIQEVRNIAEQLAAIDEGNAEAYRANASRYVERLEALRTRMHDALARVEDRQVVTFHEAFPYFAREFGLDVVGVIAEEPGQEPTAAELSDLIATVASRGVKALLTEEQYPMKAADAVARETGAKVYVFDLVVSGSEDAAPDRYEEAMEANLAMLLEALG